MQTEGMNPMALMASVKNLPLPAMNPRGFAREVLAKTKSPRASALAQMHHTFAHHAPGNRLAHRIT